MTPPKLNSSHFAFEDAHHGDNILLATQLELRQEVSDDSGRTTLATNTKVDDIETDMGAYA